MQIYRNFHPAYHNTPNDLIHTDTLEAYIKFVENIHGKSNHTTLSDWEMQSFEEFMTTEQYLELLAVHRIMEAIDSSALSRQPVYGTANTIGFTYCTEHITVVLDNPTECEIIWKRFDYAHECFQN